VSIAHDRDCQPSIYPWTKVNLPTTAVRIRTDLDNQDNGKTAIALNDCENRASKNSPSFAVALNWGAMPTAVVTFPSTNKE
jgi:hypothetical protein